MNPFEDLIAQHECILLDGAMGTLLMEAGLEAGDPPEPWNVERPDVIMNIHKSYLKMGAKIILTNSFGGNRFRLAFHDNADRVEELNKAAAEVARQAVEDADEPALVAGSIGPTGAIMYPVGGLNFDEARSAFGVQAAALEAGGADLIWIETMSDLKEVDAAYQGARESTDLPIAVTMTFDTNGRTMMGVTPEQAYEALAAKDLVAFGANCGNGPEEIEGVIAKMSAQKPDRPLIAKSNAGIPKMVDLEVVYSGTPEVMREHAARVRELGASLIGGCCGSTPEHIQAMAKALNGDR
ncbi:MAG: betaine--homocysteine S-methyltransferase [Anaerolineales bacterium]